MLAQQQIVSGAEVWGLGVPSSNLGAPTNNPRHLAFFISKVLPEKSDGEDMEALGFHI